MKFFVLLAFCAGSMFPVTAQPAYFYPTAGGFDERIPSPEKFLGYAIGSQFTRHEQLLQYFLELDRLSDKLSVEVIGETYEHRKQIGAIFTSPGNHAKLEEIRKAHLAGELTGNTENVPLVIHLGYNVHGNEPSSSEAAMLTAYYLVANTGAETNNWLSNMVITMDPVINPDGRDRHTHWANMHKAFPPVADPQDREHNEIWPGGRFNHYWFDLNRDWFLGTFPETRNRINFFHRWRPYVQTDHHEMGTNSTFYFDPGKDGSNNPLVPDFLYRNVYPKYGEYFSAAANAIGSMYYTKESFDKLYPGYGSSYINFYGGAGFLFEQASSRGFVQETSTIPLQFAFTIRNQFTASLTTIRASIAEKAMLLKMRKGFYETMQKQAASSAVKAYRFGDASDQSKTNAFLSKLLLHRVDVYETDKPNEYIVPVNQPNYLMVKSIFENNISYTDSTFYDASAWNLPYAYGLPFTEVKSSISPGKKITELPTVKPPAVSLSNYAYVFPSGDYNYHQAVYALQKGGANVQVAFRPFSVLQQNTAVKFGYGSVSVPVNLQTISSDSLHRLINKVAAATGISISSVGSGYNQSGVDLGSNYLRTVKKPEAVMLVGTGVAAPEAGEIWHLLDERVQMPVTKLDLLTAGRASFDRYNVMIMVSGNYSLLDKATTDRIKNWVQNGGTLITIKTGSEWALKNGFTKEKLYTDTTKQKPQRYNFDEASDREGARQLGGSLFRTDVDTTHPIGFGLGTRSQVVYRNNLTILQKGSNAYNTVAQFTNDPLVAGYMHPTTKKLVSNSGAIVVGTEGRGKVILFSFNPNFRGTWYGTNKLFLNALFFGPMANMPGNFSEQ